MVMAQIELEEGRRQGIVRQASGDSVPMPKEWHQALGLLRLNHLKTQ